MKCMGRIEWSTLSTILVGFGWVTVACVFAYDFEPVGWKSDIISEEDGMHSNMLCK